MRALLLALILLGFPVPALAAWHKVESPNFIIYSEGDPERTMEFARKVERFDTFLRGRFAITQAPSPFRLTVFLTGATNPAAKLISRGPATIKGFYTIGPDGPIAVVDRLQNGGRFDLDADAILLHEYVHHFTFQYVRGALPAWFVEGFAEFYSTTEFNRNGQAEFGRPPLFRGYDLLVTRAIPIERLLTADVGDLEGEERRSLYARSWLLTHFLTFEPGRSAQLGRYLEAINAGTDNLAAAKAAFGDLAQLDKDLNTYRDKRRMAFLTQNAPTPVPDGIRQSPVDPGEAATMVERIRIMRWLRQDEAPAVLAALEKARARHPQSAAVPALIANVHFAAKRDAEALAAADAALALNPAEPRALMMKGLASVRSLVREQSGDAAKWRVARSHFVKVNRAQPDNPYPLYQYFRSFTQQGTEVPPLALQGLARAHELVPQDRAIRFSRAQALLREGKPKEAVALLMPLARDPHGGASANNARRLIARVEKAMASGTNAAPAETDIAIESDASDS